MTLGAPRNRVSRRAIWYWTVRASAGWIAAAAVEAFVVRSALERADVLTWALAATALAGAVHVLVMPRWRYHVHRWETARGAVYTQSGWFDQERRIAPISRIQTVDTERGPLEQLFSLATVTVTTASAAGPLRIRGLDGAAAQALADELTAVTQATSGDAT